MPLKPMAAELADRLRNAELTYREVGQTAGMIPPGYHQVRRSVAAGSGAQVFRDAAQAAGPATRAIQHHMTTR